MTVPPVATADVRPEDASDRAGDTNVPDLDRVVPAGAQDQIIIGGVKFDRKDTVRMAVVRLAHPPRQRHEGRFRGFIVQPNFVVLSCGGKLRAVRVIFHRENLIAVGLLDQRAVVFRSGDCSGRKPPFVTVKRPARLYCSTKAPHQADSLRKTLRRA